jgi:7-cyano-7-deazaguanine synthase
MVDIQKRAILLLSGGLDSGSLLFWLINRGWSILPLHIDYGQPTEPGEWRAVKSLLDVVGLEPIVRVSIPEVESLLYEVPDSSHIGNSKEEYIPSRNLLLLTLASMYARTNGVSRIMIGLIKGTSALFPDTSSEFLVSVQKTLRVEFPGMILEAPYLNRTKFDVVSDAIAYGLLPELTFSCNLLPDRHCWQCSSCFDRHRIFEDLGLI